MSDSQEEWPGWAKQLMLDHQAQRRDEYGQSEYEMDLGWFFADDIDADGLPSERGIGAAWAEIGSWGDLAYDNIMNDTGDDM